MFAIIGQAYADTTEQTSEDIVAKTSSGDEVILHPNGYWEYVDTQKAAVAKTKVEAIAREEGCPRGTRASFFGIGRCIANNDPALKRGSGSGKGW
ncbi:MAG: hypothetical protein B7X95_07255 [Methylophilaceae bacterium 17-44-8]|jgi:hypothetical protein|nr:MAG: hypothetical protein B7Y48_01700 [Methylophilales bacterium 28-44-11]OZA05254.1 MAG: hypothetical protein B7X95_07255 [Methylophilaceae bacterium 17-44-8]